MDYSFLYNITEKDLRSLFISTSDEKLKEQISIVIKNKEFLKEDYQDYLSDRNNEKHEYLSRYQDISKKLNIFSMPFLVNLAFSERGNNIGPSCIMHYLNFNYLMYSDIELRNLLEFKYSIRSFREFSDLMTYGKFERLGADKYKTYIALINDEEFIKMKEKYRNLRGLDEFFRDEKHIEKFEGAFNTYMYIRKHLFDELERSHTFSSDDVYHEFDDKYSYVEDHFSDICAYLYSIRESINGLRLSIGNCRIIQNKSKFDKEFTEYQRDFIDGLAFGTTLEKLENHDYSDLSRIVYMPKNKVYQLDHKM